jgi:hypothetical protein
LRKGQAYIISAVIVCISLFVISSYLNEYVPVGTFGEGVQDESSLLLFTSIREAAIDAVQQANLNPQSLSGACDSSVQPGLVSNIEEVKRKAENLAERHNFRLLFNYRVNYKEDGSLDNVVFDLKLISATITLEDHFSVNVG